MIGTMLSNTAEQQVALFLKRSDIGPLFVDHMQLRTNSLSPFSEVLTNYNAGSGSISPEALEIASDAFFHKVAQVLAAPDLLIRNRLGGSMISFEEIRACAGKALGQAIAVCAVTDQGSYALRVFNDYRDYVYWWVDSFAGKNEEIVVNYIPPKVKLGSFILLLHSIDFFKRESYKNALNHAAGEEIYVDPKEFSDSLGPFVSSKDMRWLLPCFIMLVPGIERYDLNLEEEEIRMLNEMQFFNRVKKPDTQEDAFIFGEAGHTMGLEFMTSWLISAGFELSYAAPTGASFLEHFFIAPTALANHFVSFEMTGNNQGLVNHQAYTSDQLAYTLEKIIGDAVNRYAGATESTSVSPDSAAAQGEVGSKADEAQPSQWYLSQQGEQYGPYTFAQLAEYVGQGIVQPDDMVWNETLSDWVRADSVEGLFN